MGVGLKKTKPGHIRAAIFGDFLETLDAVSADKATPDMQIDAVPEDATPPREAGEAVAPVRQVPRTDPPVH